jgi:hypothetical protein
MMRMSISKGGFEKEDNRIKLLAYISDSKEAIKRINTEIDRLSRIAEPDERTRKRIDLLLRVRALMNQDIDLLLEELHEKYGY